MKILILSILLIFITLAVYAQGQESKKKPIELKLTAGAMFKTVWSYTEGSLTQAGNDQLHSPQGLTGYGANLGARVYLIKFILA